VAKHSSKFPIPPPFILVRGFWYIGLGVAFPYGAHLIECHAMIRSELLDFAALDDMAFEFSAVCETLAASRAVYWNQVFSAEMLCDVGQPRELETPAVFVFLGISCVERASPGSLPVCVILLVFQLLACRLCSVGGERALSSFRPHWG